MNLKFPHAVAAYDPRHDTVKFFAEDDGEVVPCAVSRAALERRFGARPEPEDLTRTFARNRRPIEGRVPGGGVTGVWLVIGAFR